MNEMGLDQQARFFPTPASRDYRTPNKVSYQDRGGVNKGEQLQNFVAHSLPALTIPDGPTSSGNFPTSLQPSQPFHRQGTLRAILRGSDLAVFQGADGEESESSLRLKYAWLSLRESHGRKRLSPKFVEWLMGFPLGHTIAGSPSLEPRNGSEACAIPKSWIEP